MVMGMMVKSKKLVELFIETMTLLKITKKKMKIKKKEKETKMKNCFT